MYATAGKNITTEIQRFDLRVSVPVQTNQEARTCMFHVDTCNRRNKPKSNLGTFFRNWHACEERSTVGDKEIKTYQHVHELHIACSEERSYEAKA